MAERACTNPACHEGQIANPYDVEDYDTCTTCCGTGVLHCECERAVAVVLFPHRGQVLLCCGLCADQMAADERVAS